MYAGPHPTRWTLATFAAIVPFLFTLTAQDAARTPQEILGATVGQLAALIEPAAGTPPKTLTATLRLVEAEGFGQGLAGHRAHLAFQAPDRLTLTTEIQGRELQLGRDGQQLWLCAPAKKFGLLGSPEVPRFRTRPDSVDRSVLPPSRCRWRVNNCSCCRC